MTIKLSRKWWLSIGVTVGLVALVWAMSTALAQGPDDGPDSTLTSPAGGSPPGTMTYQGRLVIAGSPANGVYDFRVSVWDAETLGNLLGSIQVYDTPGVTVTNGIFTIYFSPGSVSQVFTGGDRWLQLEVRPHGVGLYTTLPRQPITNVPYAWSLRPRAVISGTVYAGGSFGTAILNVHSSHTMTTWSALHVETASGNAVYGNSTGGPGLYGYTGDGYGVYGWDGGSTQARGYGGYFYSANGIGVQGYSGASRTAANTYAPGVYGRSYYGVGVYGRSLGDSGVAGVLGWGRGGAGGRFISYSDNLIEGYEQPDPDNDGALYLRFRVDGSGEVYADGGYHCGKDSSCWYTSDPADFAEVLPAANDPEPGDVLVVNPDGHLTPSTAPYQTNVVGVYSTNPMVIGNGENLDQEGYAPLAIAGLVPVKASAENGPIQPGDLLVASATPGHAMKAGPNPPVGSVVGKALESLDEGTGVIQMLVMLQ